MMEIMQPNVHQSQNFVPKRCSYIKPPIPPKPKIIPEPKFIPQITSKKLQKEILLPSVNNERTLECPKIYLNGNLEHEDPQNGIHKSKFSMYSRKLFFEGKIPKKCDYKTTEFPVQSKIHPNSSVWFTESYHNDLDPNIDLKIDSDSHNNGKISQRLLEDVSSTLMEVTLEDCVELCSKSSSGSNISLAESEGDISMSTKDQNVQDCLKSRYSIDFSGESLLTSEINISGNGEQESGNKNEDNRQKKLFLVAREIMTSEESFVDTLKLINEKFMIYLKENNCIRSNEKNKTSRLSDCIPEEDLQEIFKYLTHLQSLNEEILSDFRSRIDNWEEYPKIADIIVKKGPFLKLYANYIMELEGHCNLLEECSTRYSYFGQCLREFENSEICRQIPLNKHMLTPMQRITKYKELMKQYLKYLSEDSTDFADAVSALKIVKDVAQHANEAIRELENSARLLSLQERLNGFTTSEGSNNIGSFGNPNYLLVEPGRKLLKEGQLMKLCRRDVRLVYLILLSDCLLYTTQELHGGRNCSLKLRYKLPLEGMRVDTPVSEDFQTEFSVISTSRSFTVRASSAKERDEWIFAIKDAIESNVNRRFSFEKAKTADFQPLADNVLGKQAPAWIPDNRVTMCQSCTSEFSLTFRRHHCRACGKVVCRYCSANRAPLAYLDYQSERVCDHCFEELKKMAEDENDDNKERRNEKHAVTKGKFKRGVKDSTRKSRAKKPERLMEVSGGDHAPQICGYLRQLNRKTWKQSWFVLKDKVLYEYRAPEDVCALSSLPILGYSVSTEFENADIFDGMDELNAFQLLHSNQPPLIFYAESNELAEKWRSVMEKEVLL